MPKIVELTVPAGTVKPPGELIAMFEAAGFEFSSKACPVKFKGEIDVVRNDDGSSTYIQTIPDQ